jgi:hypothetical protein
MPALRHDAQVATSVTDGAEFASQLASLTSLASDGRADVKVLSRALTLMRALVTSASASLYHLPRLESSVQGAVASASDARAALAAAEARHAAEIATMKELHNEQLRELRADMDSGMAAIMAAVRAERAARELSVSETHVFSAPS